MTQHYQMCSLGLVENVIFGRRLLCPLFSSVTVIQIVSQCRLPVRLKNCVTGVFTSKKNGESTSCELNSCFQAQSFNTHTLGGCGWTLSLSLVFSLAFTLCQHKKHQQRTSHVMLDTTPLPKIWPNLRFGETKKDSPGTFIRCINYKLAGITQVDGVLNINCVKCAENQQELIFDQD